ncbi:MAG: hypothetical protein C4K48_03645 [Candidatus Thorarchaeota archaeon]|nr:MAG: hypothetical protein C4K48_03645 [Candidatus Thorarchaeota archaeon]
MEKTFEQVEKKIREKSFGILSTISPSGGVQSSAVQYAVSRRESHFALYILSDGTYVKVKNIQRNSKISFVIPFPHHILRFIPAPTVSFQGTAEVLPFDDSVARAAYSGRAQKRMVRFTEGSKYRKTAVFLKLTPIGKLTCFGLGIKLAEMMKDPLNARYTVLIPSERLQNQRE